MKRIFTKLSLFLAVMLLITSTLSAQQRGTCGITEQSELKSLLDRTAATKELIARGLTFPRAISYVPVVFHIVTDAAGAGGVNETNILNMLCGVNDFYRANEIQFYIKELRYVKNDALNTNPKGFAGTAGILANKQGSGLNVFLVRQIGSNAIGTVLGYYQNSVGGTSYDNDCIVIINSQVSRPAAATAAHEFGHLFGMPHTFSGWDANPFAPTAAQPCAPTLSPGGNQTEFVARTGARSNCNVGGDLFCDTPAEYDAGILNVSGCGPNYTGNMKDPDCVLIQPSFINMMSYFNGCETEFSTQQKANIKADLTTNSFRAYLRPSYTPSIVPITDSAVLVTPMNTTTTTSYNNILFDWNDVTGARNYVIEFSRFSSFSVSLGTIVVYNQSFLNYNAATYPNVTALLPGTQYYWRIRPWSDGVLCPAITTFGWNAPKSFTTGPNNSTNEIAGLTAFNVSPNPVSKNTPLELSINTINPIEGKIKILSITGQLLREEAANFQTGASSKSINISGLANGMYIVSLETSTGVMNKKFVIAD
jgi:hypothetical protein